MEEQKSIKSTQDFTDISYLKNGNTKQKLVFEVLTENKILSVLDAFEPILVGTIPINIDIENSDLDIICYYKSQGDFIELLNNKFSHIEGYKMQKYNSEKDKVITVNFKMGGFEIEIFGQNTPTKFQNAYRHMLIEHQLLNERGEIFRQKIIALKQQGYKTEPAFGMLLELKGNPYVALLDYENK